MQTEQRLSDEENKRGRIERPDCAYLYQDEHGVWHLRLYEAKINSSSAEEALSQIQKKRYVERVSEWIRNKHDIILLKENVTCFGVYLDKDKSVKVRSDKAV